MRRLLSSTEETTVWSSLSIEHEDVDGNALVSLVRLALLAESPWRSIASVCTKNAQLVMDILQEVVLPRLWVLDEYHPTQELDLPLTDGTYRSTCIKCLSALGKSHNVLPVSFLCSDVRQTSSRPVNGGGFADIWKGRRDSTGKDVCLKILRVFMWGQDKHDILKSFYNEALLWRQLRHRHVLPLIGVCINAPEPSFYLVSPWMSNGNIMDFLSIQPKHDRFQSVLDIGKGIQYLHGLDPPVLHADIRGANILVADDLRCVLADFGISMIASETQSPGSSTRRQGTVRWMPPEMLKDSLFEPQYLLARDIYSFGCTILEIYTGRPPFSHLKSDGCIIANLFLDKGKPAPRPPLENFPLDALWSLVTDCMLWHAKDRPTATRILHRLLRMEEQSSSSLCAHPDPATCVYTPTYLGYDSESDSVYSPPSAEDSDLSLTLMVDSSPEQSVSTPPHSPPSKEKTNQITLHPNARVFAFSGSRNQSKRLNPDAQVFVPPRSTIPEVPLNPSAGGFAPRGDVTRAGGLNPNAAVFRRPSAVIGQKLSPDAPPFISFHFDERQSSLSPKAEAFAPRLEVKKNLNADACVFHPRSRYHGTFKVSPS
ncbi:kinase-like domain-containing protein [Mucidula mucida]|nr:kinase-like domain-containing protein [Mucidula mucida]